MSDRELLENLVEDLYVLVGNLRKSDLYASEDDKLVEMGRKEAADEIDFILRAV